MQSKEYDMVFALSMLAATRLAHKTMTAPEGTEPDPDSSLAEEIQPIVKNVIMEHLSPEQMAALLAEFIAREASNSLGKVCKVSLMMNGDIQWDHIIKHTDEFCTNVLGRPVSVLED